MTIKKQSRRLLGSLSLSFFNGHLSLVTGLVVFLCAPTSLPSRESGRPEFKYVGGTEALRAGCSGTLELTSAALTFKCPSEAISIPYSSITLMQYRSDISRRFREQKLKWKIKPPHGGGGRNHYFAVLFAEGGATRAMVLAVSPRAMRPYLAEIDLKTGKRVEVQSHEEYE